MRKRCCRWLRWQDKFEPATALQPLVTLFAFFVTQVLAGFLLEQEKGVRPWHIVVYGILGAVTLSVIVSILLTRKGNRGEEDHACYCYDRATYLTGLCVFYVCLFTLTVFCATGLAGIWPGQKLRPLVVTDVKVADQLVNGLPGLAVDVLLNERQFAGGMPLAVDLYVHRNSEPSKLWRAAYVDMHEIGSSGASVPTLAEGTVRQNTDPTRVIITGMVDGPTYKATVCLVPTDVDYEAGANRLREIGPGNDKSDDLIKERDDIIKKWREYVDQAQSQISGEGGIPIDFSGR